MGTGRETTTAGHANTGPDLGTAEFTHQIRVRYGDCDMQGVVFNPNYFGYVDDAMDTWLQARLGDDYLGRFDYMVKKASIEWFAPARARDVVELRPAVTRWGSSSFEVGVRLDVGCRTIAHADLLLISVEPGAHEPRAVPDDVRRALT
jgi:acyl-CoA thioester hydrolase